MAYTTGATINLAGAAWTTAPITVSDTQSGILALQFLTFGTGTANFKISVDGATWVSVKGTPSDLGTAAATATAVGLWTFKIPAGVKFYMSGAGSETGTATWVYGKSIGTI